ncbi:Precorrin-3B C(17)-methyltransferase [Hartmannibacter diazotrophicus]|uniref:Precorrin-3B C(17)-methyltransferase n=1 Tax=Hartmannibacter diazotrophicus TaxID=1482074 RepID=A0A2C9D8F1_9HYPH|nr:precorrin-3B C(17)-methyltransferase [Hartmannibacter diazotrophicus]SON56602.1 Precorrin-3B C(17)-methyltransferase [Hartmannibacter diazotrophicus]
MSDQKPAGSLKVVGLGPGPDAWLTPEAASAVAEATDLVGYIPYVARCPEKPGQIRHASDNRVELDRARQAIDLARAGRHVAVVSGGDPGVFAMAAAVIEAIDADPVPIDYGFSVLPGISAMQAAAARLGAPLGGDFCAISLSDNLKPWAVIEKRLRAASEGDFVMAFYNPASKARPDGIHDAFRLLRRLKAATTPVAFARAVGRTDEHLTLTTLGEADPGLADMSTLVVIGSSLTRFVDKGGQRLMLTPRSVEMAG